MKTLFGCFAVAALAATFPTSAHAQFGFFGGPSFGSPVGFGAPYGGYSYGGWPYGGYGGYPYFSGTVITPVIYSVSTPAYDPPRIRPALWPAIPYRPAAIATVEGSQASIDVRVPDASTQIWIDGTLMRQSGIERHFITPALEPGSVYTMEVRASWTDAA